MTHAANSPQVTIQTPGYYEVSFHGTVSPVDGVTFPLTVGLYLTQQGSAVSGAAVQHTFHTSAESANLALSQIIPVDSVPSVLQVSSTGGNFAYGGITMTVQKIGELSSGEEN